LDKPGRVSFFSLSVSSKIKPGKPYKRGRLSTVDLLVITSSDQLLFYIESIIYPCYKVRRSTVLSLPLQLVLPGKTYKLENCTTDQIIIVQFLAR